MDLGSLRRHLKLGPRLTRAWQEMEQITIGAIEGFCVGGGVALAVALDFRVMARDAHLRVPEIGLGMNMSWQSVPRMLHLIGPARTKQAVILADQRISAAEAHEWGLVEEVADPGQAFDAAMVLAAKVAAQPPLSVAMTKLTVNRLAHALDDLASHMDVDQFALASLTEDHKEGVAAFLGPAQAAVQGAVGWRAVQPARTSAVQPRCSSQNAHRNDSPTARMEHCTQLCSATSAMRSDQIRIRYIMEYIYHRNIRALDKVDRKLHEHRLSRLIPMGSWQSPREQYLRETIRLIWGYLLALGGPDASWRYFRGSRSGSCKRHRNGDDR